VKMVTQLKKKGEVRYYFTATGKVF